MPNYPITKKPDDLTRLLKALPLNPPAQKRLEPQYFKDLGFQASSVRDLRKILQQLGLLDPSGELTQTGHSLASEEGSAAVLAKVIKAAYAPLFEYTSCPYLESDDEIFELLQKSSGATNKQVQQMLDTFRLLSELADFQELLNCDEEPSAAGQTEVASGQPHPGLQLTINLHIDPQTPDEKIAAIFKNMRRYLLRKFPAK